MKTKCVCVLLLILQVYKCEDNWISNEDSYRNFQVGYTLQFGKEKARNVEGSGDASSGNPRPLYRKQKWIDQRRPYWPSKTLNQSPSMIGWQSHEKRDVAFKKPYYWSKAKQFDHVKALRNSFAFTADNGVKQTKIPFLSRGKFHSLRQPPKSYAYAARYPKKAHL